MYDEQLFPGGSRKIPRNAPCPCGSGKKYKKCCGADHTTVLSGKAADNLRAFLAALDGPAEPDPTFTPPEGVRAEEPPAKYGLRVRKPIWRMELEITEDHTPQDDAERVIEHFVRPYSDRYCTMMHGEAHPDFSVVLLEIPATPGEGVDIAPVATLGTYRHYWEMLQRALESFFTDCYDSTYTCTVRFDQMFGGPFLTLAAGSTETHFLVSRTDTFGEAR